MKSIIRYLAAFVLAFLVLELAIHLIEAIVGIAAIILFTYLISTTTKNP